MDTQRYGNSLTGIPEDQWKRYFSCGRLIGTVLYVVVFEVSWETLRWIFGESLTKPVCFVLSLFGAVTSLFLVTYIRSKFRRQ